MLGAVIGDVVGSVYEFHNTRDYNFPMFSPSSNYTDDTVMTMAVADWTMKCKAAGETAYPHQLLEECMVKVANAYPCPMGGYGGKFRLWLFHPQSLTDDTTGKLAVRRCPYNSWGNGSAMRVSSIGWLFDTLEETERVAGISASITHNHPEGIKGAQAVAAVIYLARTGSGKEEIKQYIEKRFGYNLNESWEHLYQTYRWDSSCQGTLPQALIAFLESKDMESALRMAVSMGGDSDTLACITGAVAEAYYQEIPSFIADKVLSLLPEEFLSLLKQLADGAYASCYAKYIAGYTPAKTREYTPDRISSLKPGEVFVFGSNLAGHHGGGAARLAYERFGAKWGTGVGMTGQCYAIPTMQGGVETIRPYVKDFVAYAKVHPENKFWVTRIGCGIAGFKDREIAPLFTDALDVPNIILPKTFYDILMKR